MNTLKHIFYLLTNFERKRAALILLMIQIMALLDMVGVASIMPFIALIAKPDLVESNTTLNLIYTTIGFTDTDRFLVILGIVVASLLIISLSFRAFTTYHQLRFSLMCEYSIGKRLVEGYLNQPYSWFLGRHSSDIGKNILSEVNIVITQAFVPIMNLVAQSSVAIALLLLLLYVNPKIAIVAGLTLSAAYILIFRVVRSLLVRIGKARVKANRERFKEVNEAFSAVKEIKVLGLESTYVERFSRPAQTYAQNQASAQITGQLPRYAIEAIAFGGMLILILHLMTNQALFADALPIIALYAYAGYRLMPALQQIYAAATQLRFSSPSLKALYDELKGLQAPHQTDTVGSISLTDAIIFHDVNYQYPGASNPTLKSLNIRIPAKSTVALVGKTGSGKTTIVDLMLGLLEPQRGTLSVDDQVITRQNQRDWRRVIGYVPQSIYLSDETIEANIAFGVAKDQIDKDAVIRAAKIAKLHDFITNELPKQYLTTLGERGVRLSGGQRQRIGIARALYRDPQVLILDEATSALDNLTEKAVMEALESLGGKITIIQIAHRLSTIKNSDNILLFDKGELKEQGNFEEIYKKSEQFRLLAAET